MRQSLLLSLWAVGSLSSPCKPGRAVTHNNYDLPPPVLSTNLAPTQPGQDTVVNTHTAGGSDEDISVPKHSTETFTNGSGSDTIKLPGGSVTFNPVSPSETRFEDGDTPETSQASDSHGATESQTSNGAESTGGPGQPGQSSGDATGTRTAILGGNDTTPLPVTGTATEVVGQPSGEATNSGSTSDESSLAGGVGATEAETSVFGGDATQLPSAGTATGVADLSSTDTSNGVSPTPDTTSPSDGVAVTQTVTDVPIETSIAGAVPTEGSSGAISTEESSADDTGSASLTLGKPDATEAETDRTTDVPATTKNSSPAATSSPRSRDKTISPSGNATHTAPIETEGPGDATSLATTDAQDVNTETASAGVGNTSLDTETTGVAPGQSSTTVPSNTDASEETTESGSSDLPAPTTLVASTELDIEPTGAVTGTETTVDSPQETSATTGHSQDNSSNETTNLGVDSTAVDATTTRSAQSDETDVATQPTNDNGDVTTQPAADNSDTTTVDVSSNNDGPSTAVGLITTDAADTTPSTSAPNGNGPSVTLNPAPVTTTTPGDAQFPTITDVPEGLASSTVSGHPEWTSNTWITTTSGDSSEPTIVPVLVGCKQCGGSGSGIILWNSPKTTNIWFQLPGLPKFTFPCIPPGCSTPPTTSEGNDNDDGEDDDDEEPSSTTCTDKATVTDCFVACTTYTGPAGASITPECSTTCTATHTGCSVTGTTTTSSAAACGPSGDDSCRICGDGRLPQMGLSKRSGDFLAKRGREQKRAVGGCPAFSVMPYFPAYPGGDTILDNDALIISTSPSLNMIKRWWLTTRDNQCKLVLRGNLDAATFIKDRTNPAIERPSIDHVFEKSMLMDYFNAIIDPKGSAVKGATTGGPRDKINCQDMEAYGGATKNSKKKLLQKVFDTYPGGTVKVHKNKVTVKDARYLEDLIGMDQWTNGDAKGVVANAGDIRMLGDKWSDVATDVTASTSEDAAKEWIESKLSLLEFMLIGIEMFSAPEAIDIMIRQNQRIYARLIDMDNEAKGCMNDPAVKNGLWSFADRYKTFMQTRFNGQDPWSINTEVGNAKTKVINKLKTDLVAAVNVRANDATLWTSMVAEWNTKLAILDDPTRQWAVPEPAWVWTWIKKRDGEDSTLSCDRPIPSDTTTSEESTTFATSTRTSSEESSSEESSSSTEEQTSSSEEMTTSTTEDSVQLTDFPTLTNAPPLSISTPDGSSCASTATYTQCNLGTGNHGGACVTNSQCASWVNTETTSTTATPTPTMESPDPSQNIKHCYDDGPKVSYDSITVNAESFCNKVVAKNKDNGYYWSNDKLEEKLLPGGGGRGYHFKALFAVKEGCLWKADFDECMRYMKVPIDSCDCSAKGNKQGGWVENNCITAKMDPNKGD